MAINNEDEVQFNSPEALKQNKEIVPLCKHRACITQAWNL